ncbi:autotransporter outer membrane beta-barrel domain-containing protein [Enterobacteriaceae bacterium RIT691]|nr:autotransporter outer membrane beta-barrel domain-containing protein [Enterobacteriaceae bacterium RIT691]
MNKIYRVVWSSALGLWVVASETTRSRKKGRVRRAMRAATATALTTLFLSSAALADETVNWSQSGTYQPAPDKDGVYDDFGYFATLSDAIAALPDNQHKTYTGGTRLTINGPVPDIEMGTNGTFVNKTLKDLLASGAIKSLKDSQGNDITINNIDQYVVSSGYTPPNANTSMDLKMPGTDGGVEQIDVYNSADFQDAGTNTLGDITVPIYDFSAISQYNHFGISHISNDGGDVTIDIGADTLGSTAIADAQNTLRMYTKNTELTLAEGAQGNSSQTHWQSDNYIQFGGAITLPTDTTSGKGSLDAWSHTIEIPTFTQDAKGNVIAGPTQSFAINSLKDIATVNDFLTQSVNGKPSQLQLWLTGEVTIKDKQMKDPNAVRDMYQAFIQELLDARQSQDVNWTYNIWSDDQAHSGNATQDAGTVSVIFATGNAALGEITQDGSLAVSGSHQGVMHGEEGAQIINNGALNTWNDTGARADGMYVSNATAINNGTLNAGLFIEKDGSRVNHIAVSNVDISNQGSVGIFATGASSVTNNGPLNVALADNNNGLAEGIHAEGSTAALNTSAINVVNNPRNALGSATAYGVNVLDNATFTNASTGTIKLGEQLDSLLNASDEAVMEGGSAQSAAIRSQSAGDVINEGLIQLGKYVRNAVGMLSEGGLGKVINNGRIDVLGTSIPGSSSMAGNFGLYAHDASGVINNGEINVGGAGNSGLRVYADAKDAHADSTATGAITVIKNSDGSDDLKYRNYAVYVGSKDDQYQATANIDSSITLNAQGAIGVHVRNNAIADLGRNTTVSFNNSDQIGYYAYGDKARLNLENLTLNDNQQTHTTLFLLDHGATFDGDNIGYDLTLTGDNSVGVLANGAGTTVSTGKAKIHVANEGGVGVEVTGGASGTIANGAIVLEHDNTTAVVVDGQGHGLDGTDGNTNSATTVTSDANIGTLDSQSNVTGYHVSHQGVLNLSGNSSLDIRGQDNIGVNLDTDGTLNNQSSSALTVSGNGRQSGNIGVLVNGANANVQQLGTVTANGGEAAVKLQNGATLNISGTNNHISAADGADAILLADGARQLTASNTQIDVTGTGAGIQNDANNSDIQLNNVTINAGDGPAIRTSVSLTAGGANNVLNVTGNDATGNGAGFAFENKDSSDVIEGKDLSIGGSYVINVGNAAGDATGSGIRARTTGNVSTSTTVNILDKTGGSALLAENAKTVTNSGKITTASDGAAAINAKSASTFTNTGDVESTSTSSTASLVDLSGTDADTGDSKTVTNSGSLNTASQDSVVLNVSSDTNNSITNTGTLSAANGGTALLSGAGSDTILFVSGLVTGNVFAGDGNDSLQISGGSVVSPIDMGNGSDAFSWSAGTLAGSVDFRGAQGNDQASIGDVDLSNVTHVLTESNSGNALTFTDTHGAAAKIGSFGSDDLSKGTNIGSGWNALTVTGAAADLRVVDNLLGVSDLSITNGATLRSGDNAEKANEHSIGQLDVTTAGGDSKLVLDGDSDTVYRGIISGDGQLERAGSATTVLLGDNTYTGQTTIDAGTAIQVGNGGTEGALSEATRILDNGLFTVDLSKELTLGGVISGSGSFHQDGSGLTRLNGDNAWAGETRVNQGSLIVNGNQSAAGGDVTVADNALLGGHGTLGGNVIMGDNATLQPGDIGTGTLTISNGKSLTLGKNTLSDFEFGESYRPGGNLNDLVDVAGDLTLGGTLNVSTAAGGSFGPGVYRIYNYGGSLHNDGQLTLGSLPAGTTDDHYYIQTNVDHEVNLVNDGGLYLQFWDGAENTGTRNHGASGIEGDGRVDGGDGSWSARGERGDNNWTTASGQGNAPWSQYAYAIFEGAAGTVTVTSDAGNVHFAGAQFASDGYVVTGDALHAVDTQSATAGDSSVPSDPALKPGDLWVNVGDGTAESESWKATIESNLVQANTSDTIALVKGGTGVLILKGNNDYLGGTRIEGGTLQVQGNQNLGAADSTITINNNSTLQNGADWETTRGIILGDAGGQLDLNSHALKDDGVISGNGPLTVRSSSADADSLLTLLGDNTWQGGTAIIGTDHRSNVVVDAQTSAALGEGSSNVALSHGATLNLNNGSSALTHHFSVDDSLLALNDTSVAADAIIDISNNGNVQFNDNAQGDNAQINVGDTAALAMNNSADAGQAQVVNKGHVSFNDKAQGRSATVNNQQGGIVSIAGAEDETDIGSLFGAGNVELGAKTLNEGALNRDDAISGIISGENGSLVKEGSGTLTLSGDNTYTGTTHVEQGVLLVNGNQQAATGDVTVDAGTTLGGNGIIGGNVTIADNGHIAAGEDLGSIGKLTTGSLTLNQNSQLDYQLGEAYIVGGKLNDLIDVNGDLNLDGKLNITETSGGHFGVGVYRLINYTGSLQNNGLDIANAPEAADSLYVQTSVNHQVNLVNRAGLQLRFWDGAGGKEGELKNNGAIDGGDGVWQSSAGNDNWTTDGTNPSGALNAPFDDDAFAVFEGEKGTVTVDKSLGDVWISGAQFATDGYVVQGDALNTHTADTIIRVGDGTVDGLDMTATINSVIQGTGGIDKNDVGTLVLNGDNTYSGGTTVSGGVLNVSADHNLGVHETTLTLNGGTLQYAKGFDTDRQVVLGESGGGIDTNGNQATLSTALTGSGKLTKLGKGTLTLTADSEATGGTTINGGVLQLGNGGTTGAVTGDIEDNTALAVNRSNTLALDGNISGKGEVQQIGSGTTVLNGDNSYSGMTRVTHGILRAGGTQTLSENSVHTVYQGALLDTQGYDQHIAGMNNAGSVNLTSNRIGAALTVKGNYVGDNGTINLAAQQKGSEGTADKLVIDGGTASGKTTLNVDISRLGAPTHGNGIEVVEARNGATTTAQSTRDAFTLGADHLEAGAFEYHLFAGDLKSQGENWYLRTDYRSEVPLFNGIAQAVRTGDIAVLSNLHKRMGDENTFSKGKDDDKRVWARYLGEAGRTRLNDAAGTSLDSHMNGVQVGSDLWTNAQWKTGFYTSLLDNDSSVDGQAGGSHGYVGDIKDHALYMGGYATWTADNGFWVDNVLQYGRHDLRLKTHGKTYDSNGNSLTASVEIGKPYQLGESRWQLEPQAQLIWQHSRFDDIDVKGDTKTKAAIDAGDSVTARIGTRLVGHYQTKEGEVTPYVRVNLWQGMGGSDDTRFSNNTATTHLTAGQRYSSTEAAAGATWSVKPNIQFYGEIGREWSNKGQQSDVSKDVTGSIGFKGSF